MFSNRFLICIFTLLISIHYVYSSSESDNPVRSEIEILTPPEYCIAGDTISLVVKIYSENDSLFRGLYCFNNVIFQDTLGNGGKPDPIVVVDSGIDTINELPLTAHSARECFNDGIDTIKMVLYNAPISQNNQHKIIIHLDNMLITTGPFHLYPGKIDSLDIQSADGSSMSDTVLLNAPGDSRMFYVAGFGRYGNRIPGWTLCNWSVSGNLDSINGKNVGQIYYESGSVTINKSGDLTATSADPSAPLYVKDHVFIKILGPAINITRAITRDLNGNGYLDHIELHFALPVSLPANFNFSGLSISYGTTNFSVTGIENNTGRTDNLWSIAINEVQNNIPQTSWEPHISFDRNESLSITGATNMECQDGAGPVMWRVENQRGKVNELTEDLVTITLSEPVIRSIGSSLTLTDTPSVVFNVWKKDPMDTTQFKRVDNFLAGINSFTKVINDSIFQFTMLNGNDLTPLYFINVNTSNMYITDKHINFANPNNQKVRVLVFPHEEIRSDETSTGSNGCGCGTGAGLAFIPPIFMRARYRIKKYLKKPKNT